TRFSRDWSSDVCSSDLGGGWCRGPRFCSAVPQPSSSLLLVAYSACFTAPLLAAQASLKRGPRHQPFRPVVASSFALGAPGRAQGSFISATSRFYMERAL